MTNAVNIAQSGSNNQTMRNRIINGAMGINQRGFSGTVTADGDYGLDRWQMFSSASSKYSLSQSSDAPTGFINSTLVTSLAATSVGATDYYFIRQCIEGLNCTDLGFGTANASTVTLSFWVKSSLTGSFGGTLENNAQNRSYPFSFTINSANTWEYKSVTVAGDTTGTWLTTNGIGIMVQFGLGVGSTYSDTAGAWTSKPSAWSATGAVSVVGTNGATWQVTGVQLEEGTAASPFENRLYGTELQLCQRYYYRLLGNSAYEGIGNGYAISYSSTQCQGPFVMPVKLRTSPSLSYSSNLKVSDVYSYSRAVSSMSVSAVNNGTDCAYLDIVSSSLSTGRVHYLGADNSTSAFVAFVAEL